MSTDQLKSTLATLGITDPIETAIGENIEFDGRLKIRNGKGIAIFGKVTGSIESDGVVVLAAGSKLQGTITADVIAVAGEIETPEGEEEIHARLGLILSSTARIVAESVAYDSIQMERGARVDGRMRFVEAPKDAVARREAKTSLPVRHSGAPVVAVSQASGSPLPTLLPQDRGVHSPLTKLEQPAAAVPSAA